MRRWYWMALAVALAAVAAYFFRSDEPPALQSKLYWFIPDGMRADPEVFNVFRWADEGKLPNLRRLMARGSYGYSKPTFPSHTPTNFATLFTGTYPEHHGVNDGPMHEEGRPLDRVSVGGFSAAAKLVEPIWVTLERQADARIALLSVPGTTPPELSRGITVRGRWGGWGADFHAVNFEEASSLNRRSLGRSARLFFFGAPLTKFPERRLAAGWAESFETYSEPWEAELEAWGGAVQALIVDSVDDGIQGYDRVVFSMDKHRSLVTLAEGEWSDWLPITLTWRVAGVSGTVPVATSFRIKLIRLDPSGLFRVRFFFDNVNKHLTDPPEVAAELQEHVGPMVDFVDNFPPQLIFYPEDKTTFLEEAMSSLAWHRSAVGFLLDRYSPDVLIHDIYTPNQMLTSRWWMGYIDPASARYGDVDESTRATLWKEVEGMYAELDAICGELLKRADGNTLIVLSSDHGAVPLDQWVRLNNLFAQEGLLRFSIDAESGEPEIDWAATQAIYLKMQSVYLNPNGLAGSWQRASGEAYEKLRERVRALLVGLRDAQGRTVVADVVGWEEARARFRLLPERVGDLVIANEAGFGWSEEMTEDREVFAVPLKSGYKQAILAEENRGMWTPFVIAGPGVRRGHFLGERPIDMVDQYATLMHLLGQEISSVVQGEVLTEVLEGAK